MKRNEQKKLLRKISNFLAIVLLSFSVNSQVNDSIEIEFLDYLSEDVKGTILIKNITTNNVVGTHSFNFEKLRKVSVGIDTSKLSKTDDGEYELSVECDIIFFHKFDIRFKSEVLPSKLSLNLSKYSDDELKEVRKQKKNRCKKDEEPE